MTVNATVDPFVVVRSNVPAAFGPFRVVERLSDAGLATSAAPVFADDEVSFRKDVAPILLSNCIACHGVGAAGDGPEAEGMNPPPANLLEGHAIYHFDAEFFNWISDGKPRTDMPGFSQSLTE